MMSKDEGNTKYTLGGEVLANYATEVTKATSSGRVTAINHFVRFLATVSGKGMPLKSFEELTASDLSVEIIGLFPDYLIKNGIRSDNTLQCYMSHLKESMIAKIPGAQEFFNDGQWYAKMRRTTKKKFNELAAHAPATDKEISMRTEDFKWLCKTWFESGEPEDLVARSMISMNWALIGRFSEIGCLSWNTVSYTSSVGMSYLSVGLNRSKTTQFQTNLSLFMYYNEWHVCPLHAVATMMVCGQYCSDNMFTLDNQAKSVAFINRMLRQMYECNKGKRTEIPHYTSYSLRYGAMQFLSEFDSIKADWVERRGGFSPNYRTVMRYAKGSAKEDFQVGRGIANWPNVEAGGRIPDYEDFIFSEEERELFLWKAEELFRGPLRSQLKLALLSVLVLRYASSYAERPTHRLHTRLQQAFGHEVLLRWSSAANDDFSRRNLFPTQFCSGASVESAALMTAQNLQTKKIVEMQREIQMLKEGMKAMEDRITQRIIETLRKESQLEKERLVEQIGVQLKEVIFKAVGDGRTATEMGRLNADFASEGLVSPASIVPIGLEGSSRPVGGPSSFPLEEEGTLARSDFRSIQSVATVASTSSSLTETKVPSPAEVVYRFNDNEEKRPPLPALLSDWANVQMQDMFYAWYDEEIHKVNIENYVTGKPLWKKREIRVKMARVVAYMKLFLPPTVIAPKPELGSPALSGWRANLQSIAIHAASKLHEFVLLHKREKFGKKSKMTKSFIATQTYLQSLPRHLFPRTTCNHVVDQATHENFFVPRRYDARLPGVHQTEGEEAPADAAAGGRKRE